jgi:dihydrodipicolinate synthase/N-acetylneuraminate lyase
VAASQAILAEARGLLESCPLQPATKTALSAVAGLPPTAVRPPQVELTPEQRAAFSATLRAALPRWRPAAA